MSWPEPSDYQDAIQSAQLCFVDSGLRRGSVALTQHGLPRPMSGNFACVFEVRNGVSRWAVKCFLRQVAGQEKRYAALSQQLVGMRLPCLVGFEYLPQGILVKGQWYPIVKMEWSAGEALHLYVERHLNDGKTLLNLAAQWRGLVNSLRGNGIAHGDLQHGNVQVATNGQIELVDYDAMYVPALRGDVSPELGHSNFQHPKRKPSDFDASLDNFAALVVYTSLRALAVDPGLWRQYHTGENLIFRQQDFVAPKNSPAFRSLANSQDRGVRLLAETLAKCCMGSITQVPALEAVVGPLPPPQAVAAQSQSVIGAAVTGQQAISQKEGLSKFIGPALISIPIILFSIGFLIPKTGGDTTKENPPTKAQVIPQHKVNPLPPTMKSSALVLGMGESQIGFERDGSTGYVYWHGRLLDDSCLSEKRYVLLSSPSNRYVAGFCSLTGEPNISPSRLLDNQNQEIVYSGFGCMFGNGTPQYSWIDEDTLGSATCHINVADLMKARVKPAPQAYTYTQFPDELNRATVDVVPVPVQVYVPPPTSPQQPQSPAPNEVPMPSFSP